MNPSTPPRNAGNRRTQGRIDLSRMEVCLPSTTPHPHHVPPRAALPYLAGRYSCRILRLCYLPMIAVVTRVQAASLRRYRKVHKLGESPPGSSKEELLPAVARHFAAQASTCLAMPLANMLSQDCESSRRNGAHKATPGVMCLRCRSSTSSRRSASWQPR